MTRFRALAALLFVAALALSACGDSDDPPVTTEPTAPSEDSDATVAATTSAAATTVATASAEPQTFILQAWSDNWFAAYVNGDLIGEDSVPITTERSFNSETFTFEAVIPFTLAVITRDFIEDDSGLEYIGTDRQQMGDGGFIAQLIDADTGSVIAGSDASWVGLVIHAAPLNKACESSVDPSSECESAISEAPTDWTLADFDSSNWTPATIHSEAAVSPKDGYDEIAWDTSAALIWSADLETDNTILWRVTIEG